MRSLSISESRVALVAAAFALTLATSFGARADSKPSFFTQEGAAAPVRINWGEFQARNFEVTLAKLEHAVRNTITRWRTATGINARFYYDGTTTGCVSNGVMITMEDSHNTRYGGTYSCGSNGLKVVLYRERDTGIQFNWAAWTADGVHDVEAALMHEFSHVYLGNPHSNEDDNPYVAHPAFGWART